MLPIPSGQTLKWLQPNWLKMEYELHAGEEVVATLRFRSSFGTLATAQSADGCWTFKRVGFSKPASRCALVTAKTSQASGDLKLIHSSR